MVGVDDYRLVVLSVAIAILASYTARDLGGRVTASRGWVRLLWLSAAPRRWQLAFGHCTSSRCWPLPYSFKYDWPTVFLSLLAGIFASAVALFVVCRQTMGPLRALARSAFVGGGFVTLHYTSIAAMRLPAMCRYSPTLVTLSALIAIAGSLISLWLTFHFRDEPAGRRVLKTASALLMGAAIGSMHYTATAAVSFAPSAMVPGLSHAVSISFLGAAGIGAVSGMVLVLALFTCLVDRFRGRNALLDELFEQAPQAVALMAANVHVVRLSKGFKRPLGYTPQQALGRYRYMDLVAHLQRVDADGVRWRSGWQPFARRHDLCAPLTPCGEVAAYAI